MPLQLLVAYLVSDHAFVNNSKLNSVPVRKMYVHFIWLVLFYLAFTFDRLLVDVSGIAILSAGILFNIGIEFLRKRIPNYLLEIGAISFYIVLSVFVSKRFETSFITPEFSWYLLGMLLVTVGATYFLRGRIIKTENADSIGISERLVIYIFTFSGHFEWVIISIIAAVIFRLVFSKENKLEWIISPVVGIVISLVWLFIMKGIFKV